jgi:hypothetical protein
MTTAVTAATQIAIQIGPDAPVQYATWQQFRADNRDAFTSDEFGALADDMADGEPVLAGMAMIWIAE